MDASSTHIASSDPRVTPWLHTASPPPAQLWFPLSLSAAAGAAAAVSMVLLRLTTKWGDGPRLKRKERVSVQLDGAASHRHLGVVCSALLFSARQCHHMHSSAWSKTMHAAALLLHHVLLQVQVSEAFNVRAKWNLEAHFPDLEG